MACVVVVVAENCDLMYDLRCGASCKMRTLSKLDALQSDDAQTFLFFVGE